MRNPFSLEAFADWCETQPPEKEYKYENLYQEMLEGRGPGCACVQYVLAIGGDQDLYNSLPRAFQAHACTKPRTFGALAQRLRRAAAKGPQL